MKKVAVIIKHPYRDFDVRIDIVEIPEGMGFIELKKRIEAEMLGPFEIIAITDRINFDRKITLNPLTAFTGENKNDEL